MEDKRNEELEAQEFEMHESTNVNRSILPALAFSLDMFAKTGESFGVNEVLLASVLGSAVFSIFAAQPLNIVGVTGNPTLLVFPEALTITRSNHGLQLYSVRYRRSTGYQLFCIHVLDRPVRCGTVYGLHS